jgi:hypothetical protein
MLRAGVDILANGTAHSCDDAIETRAFGMKMTADLGVLENQPHPSLAKRRRSHDGGRRQLRVALAREQQRLGQARRAGEAYNGIEVWSQRHQSSECWRFENRRRSFMFHEC